MDYVECFGFRTRHGISQLQTSSQLQKIKNENLRAWSIVTCTWVGIHFCFCSIYSHSITVSGGVVDSASWTCIWSTTRSFISLKKVLKIVSRSGWGKGGKFQKKQKAWRYCGIANWLSRASVQAWRAVAIASIWFAITTRAVSTIVISLPHYIKR